MKVNPRPWEVWRVAFEREPTGAEQVHDRPAVIVGTQYHCQLPNRLAIVVPLTSKDRGLIWQPRLSITSPNGGASIALVEQIRAVSYDRLGHRERQTLSGEDIEAIKFVMRQMIDTA